MSLSLEITTSDEWHILKGEQKLGPYTYAEMLEMLQKNMLFNFDYVWSPHLDSWTTVNDLSEFSQDRICRLVEKTEPDNTIFLKRQHERVMVKLPIYAHDNRRMWQGYCENLSSGGALVSMGNPFLLPGDQINIHFRKAGEQDAVFNCTAVIISKRMANKQKIQHDTNIFYAVRFLNKSEDGAKQISTWVEKNKKIK